MSEENATPVVCLAPSQTKLWLDDDGEERAVAAAYYATLSPHEWRWSHEEQLAMARYILWAKQRLDAVRQLVTVPDLARVGNDYQLPAA